MHYKVKDEEVGLTNVFDDYNAIFDVVVDDDLGYFDDWKLSLIDERKISHDTLYWEKGNLFQVWVMNDYGIEIPGVDGFKLLILCVVTYFLWVIGLMD